MEGATELMMSRLRDEDPDVQRMALNMLAEDIKASQGQVAARSQELLDMVKEIERSLEGMSGDNRRYLHDLLSVLYVLEDGNACLLHRLEGNVTKLSEWGHQYVMKLVTNILDVEEGKEPAAAYEGLVEPIVRFLMEHNSEVEAIDFIVEVSRVPRVCINEVAQFSALIRSLVAAGESGEKTESPLGAGAAKACAPHAPRMEYWEVLRGMVDEDNRTRIILYLEELESFYALRDVILQIKAYDPSQCLVAMIKYGMVEEAKEYTRGMSDRNMKKQLLYILARNSIYYRGDEEEERIMSNSHLHEVFAKVAEALEVVPPKKLEYMFKGLNKDRIDASAIANAFVHFAYCRDPVLFPQEGDFRIKAEYSDQLKINRSIATVASAGLVAAFNVPFLYDVYANQIIDQPEIGAVLALALASCRIRDADASILNLLSMFIHAGDSKDIIAALVGIAVLYTGSGEQEVYDLVFPLLSIADNNVSLFAIYVLGAVFPGDMEILGSCLDVYEQLHKETAFCNFAILGIALFFYGLKLDIRMEIQSDGEAEAEIDGDNEGNECDNVNEDGKSTSIYVTLFKRLDRHAQTLALGFMHIGTANISAIDNIFAKAFVGEIDALLESLGLISSCLAAVGDPMAACLLERIATSSLLLDSSHLRNIVPLCLAILNPSAPRAEVIDILERSINSGEANINSLIALGVVGAGSCSSRILRILDSNFCNVYKDSRSSAALIIAQGLVNLGKGLFTLSPTCYDNNIILHKSMTCLVSTLFIFLDSGMLKDYPFLLYILTGAVAPKYISGIDGIVKVGKPVNTVGMVGKPNRISASVVHSLPVIINAGERAEAEDPVCTVYIEDILVKRE